jgi:hypothetical protein
VITNNVIFSSVLSMSFRYEFVRMFAYIQIDGRVMHVMVLSLRIQSVPEIIYPRS